MSEHGLGPVYYFGDCAVDLVRRELRILGMRAPIGARAFRIIEILVEFAGELVSKNELMDRIWPGQVANDNTLQVHIAALRKALGPHRVMLKTEAGRGYRLLGSWTTRSEPSAPRPIGPHRPRQPDHVSGTNLPRRASGIIGRSTVVRKLCDLLSAQRLVTLTGPGGIGKSTLSVRTGHELVPEFIHGAWLVELAPLSDGNLVPSAVAAVLGLNLSGAEITAEAVVRAINERNLLLILDNCEHVIDGAANLAELLLQHCPGITVLATSREILRIAGEYVYRVPPLDVPTEDDDPEYILRCSAVELFIERVKEAGSEFASRAEDLPRVAAICRHLDGIPLAIEFAAARAALVGTEQVAASLRDRFALFTSGRRTAIPRHQTLRAALDWSYQLLSMEEQRLLRWLAVFPAGFTFEAVQAVGDTGRGGQAIVDELSSLVSKSLCECVNPSPSTRWRLLETIRDFALQMLIQNGEYPDAARRHAEYFRDLLSPNTASSRAWLSRDDVAACARELDNVRAALDWAFSSDGDAEIAAKLTAAFAPIWQMLSLVGECRNRVESMLASKAPDIQLSQATELRMWIAYGEALTMTFAPTERHRAVIKKVMDLMPEVDDVELHVGLLFLEWSVEFTSGSHRGALDIAQRLAAVTRGGGDTMRLAGDRILGTSLLLAGKLTDAQEYLQRVVEFDVDPSDWHHSTLFHRDQRVLARKRLARVLSLRGYVDRAYAEAWSSFESAQSSGAGITVCWVVHDALCPIAIMTGNLAAAEEAIAAMSDWATRMNAALWQTIGTCWRGKLLIDRGEFREGIEVISEPLHACEQSGWQTGYVQFLGSLAEGLAELGHLEEAGAKLQHAIAWADHNGEAWYQAELMRLKGELMLRSKPALAEEAEECFRIASQIAREQKALFWELRIALSLARLRMTQGRHDEGKRVLAPIYDRFTEGFEAPLLRAARALLDRPCGDAVGASGRSVPGGRW